MKQIDMMLMDNAGLAKAIAVLAGELLECYQWDEANVDGEACSSVISHMKVLLDELDQRLT